MEPDHIGRAFGGLSAAAIVALVGRRRGSLSPSGAFAAVPVGTIVVAGGGWWWGVVLVLFFATSSALSRLRKRERAPVADIAARGDERDAVQVLANGGLAAMLAATAPLVSTDVRATLFAAFAGAVAAVTADTWATELGAFSRLPPRSLANGRPVPPGTSGGITALGTGAAAVGALVIAATAAAGQAASWAPAATDGVRLLLGVTVAGFAGSLADSLLGATIQATYHCPRCASSTEQRVHRCGTATIRVRGLAAVDNDVVNAVSSLVGAAVALVCVTAG